MMNVLMKGPHEGDLSLVLPPHLARGNLDHILATNTIPEPHL
jgi:hypothetical protein